MIVNMKYTRIKHIQNLKHDKQTDPTHNSYYTIANIALKRNELIDNEAKTTFQSARHNTGHSES